MKYSKIESCRICSSDALALIFDLGDLHSCGYFPQVVEPIAPVAPLCLVSCRDCGLVQLQHNYDQDELFRNTYGYRSNLNASMSGHLASIVNTIVDKIKFSAGDYVLDIGSNDGTLLKSYPATAGLRRVGIDPSIEQFHSYYPLDVQTNANLFTSNAFLQISKGARARVVTSIAMFYDLPDPNAFVADIAAVLDEEGLWVFEQSYLPTMLARNAFDTICHEHLEYYALRQIIDLLKRHKMRVVDVAFNDINGGSFRIYACHENASHVSDSVKIEKILTQELSLGLNTGMPFNEFWARVSHIKTDLVNFLKKCKETGKRVHGYGASTKGNTLLQYFGITSDLIEMIADCNSTKWDRCTPGTRIPIVSEKTSRDANPDYYLVLPWHFRGNFLVREKNFMAGGGQFIFPLPEFELVCEEACYETVS
jgi:NDP-4-keto-2,6-dideoxyhexose 3-C-methyltransferase